MTERVMKNNWHKKFVALIALLLLTSGSLWASDDGVSRGGGIAKFGYTYLDEEGNATVNQETYNFYKGGSLSLDNFHYLFDNGLKITADLHNVTLNNRVLRGVITRPGQYGLALSNKQYRRNYNFSGSDFTRRQTTSGNAYYLPTKNVKLFGGYTHTNRHGIRTVEQSPFPDLSRLATDFRLNSFNVGLQAFDTERNIRFEYRSFDFNDRTTSNIDRDSRSLNVSAFTKIPKYEHIVLSGGYYYRRDQEDQVGTELITHQTWLATRAYISRQFIAEYRFLYARSDQSEELVATDNIVNTASVSYHFDHNGGVRVGYEFRSTDDYSSETKANLLMFAGWYRFTPKLSARGRFTTRTKEVKTGATLLGDEDYTRQQVILKYRFRPSANLALRYQGKSRTNDDIATKIDYNSYTAEANLNPAAYGRFNASYSYYKGQFENRSSSATPDYEFDTHVVTGGIQTVERHNLVFNLSGSYYRSQSDNDIEKFNTTVGVRYRFPHDHFVGVEYSAFNFDDFLVNDKYYTGNIVNIYLIKDFSL